jgi:hypothetical protein
MTNLEILAETSTSYGSSDNNNNNFLIIKEILYIILQRKGFTTEH